MPAQKKYSEEQLVTLLKGSDEYAYAYLYDNYSKALFGVITHTVFNTEEAEDILQTVFVKIWNNIQSYNPEKGRLYTWMLNIARNAVIDYSRSKQGQINAKIHESENIENDINKQYFSYANYDDLEIKNLLKELNKDHQTILNMAYYEGYTQVEISNKLNLPLGTVKTKVKQAITILRKIIGEY